MTTWKVKMRDYEIDKIKFEIKYIPTNENPLLKLEYVKSSTASKSVKKVTKKKMDPLSQMNQPKEKEKPKELTIISTVQKKDEKEKDKEKASIQEKKFESTPSSNKSYSLIISNSQEITDQSIDQSWKSLKDNLINLFCSNQSLIVKSLVSVSMDDDEEDLKNYKIDKGRTRLEELESAEKGNYRVFTSGEYVSKLEQLKREMFIVFFLFRNGRLKIKLPLLK